MVIDIKYIGGAFLTLAILQTTLSLYFNSEIEERTKELYEKRETINTLTRLENKWSKKSQHEELEKLKKLLNVFDVPYTEKEQRKRKVLSMELKTENVDKVIGFIVNRNISIKKLKIDKVDKHTVKLEVEII